LWDADKAERIQKPMMEYVDILISTEEDTRKVFKITGEGAEDDDRFEKVSQETYAVVAQKLADEFGFDVVAITLRENISVWKNTWCAIAVHKGNLYTGPRFEVEIVDRVGGGDSFSGGFIYGYLTQGVEYGLKFGNAFSALAHSIPGDFNYARRDEVEGLLGGGGMRIKR
jgi:2-dehydro-3-deoxygluconokinase